MINVFDVPVANAVNNTNSLIKEAYKNSREMIPFVLEGPLPNTAMSPRPLVAVSASLDGTPHREVLNTSCSVT